MANPYVNKVVINGETKLDLSGDTITADKLAEGYTAHDASGAPITGTMTGGGVEPPYIKEIYDVNGNLIDAELVGYTTIRDYAFYYCRNLALTSLPSGLTSIGQYAFSNCTNLALTSLPSGLTSIGNYAFYNCTNLAFTSLPSGLTSIGNYAFYYCYKLALTSLPSGLINIGDNAFYNCTNLKTLTFEGTPSEIKSSAFYNCTNLTTINVPWAEGAVSGAPWGATNATINYNYTGG